MKETIITERKLTEKTVIAFTVFILLFIAAIFVWKWIRNQPAESGTLSGIPSPLRKGLTIDEKLFRASFNPNVLVKTYPISAAAKKVRVNGDVGMGNDFDAGNWKLGVVKDNGDTAFFSMDDIKKLPKTDEVFDFKCIEGWSQKTWWGGTKFSDFLKYYHLDKEATNSFVGMITPDKKYYVGIDMPSALQTQTILAYEMNGKPLPMDQGYPLRLIIPVKYGIKHIKRIGTIYFSNTRPRDYWAERGYDYYSGH